MTEHTAYKTTTTSWSFSKPSKDRTNFLCTFLMISATSLFLMACESQPVASGDTTSQATLVIGPPEPGAMPETLYTIECKAESVVNIIPQKDWDEITTQVTAIAEAWQAYHLQGDAQAAPQPMRIALTKALTRLQRATAAKDETRTIQAANDVGVAVVELFSLYHPPVFVDIERLEVLEQRVRLNGLAKDLPTVATALVKIDAIWARLKSSAVAQRSLDIAAQYETSLAAQMMALRAQDSSRLIAESARSLEIIDRLEEKYY